ncbi:hypothetical protein SYNPS1DRAFT_25761 [Syncephalis pseudoplumigaleata]|uniref:Uncharacterized protein n=1 Tax=Syncephalis pseudoplumigaleata TaxID=1712513 RepID=A0A4V1J0R5_9FUNG|nr:hypothetical protein SYNPS1DRAFT_25761 [Syncephalis pseudoplumigaleata]|eukprot:RKP22479.1 hypothetical protein SYNPS1DRAFT_25761 [Syncephalis pseudoplumigaleata]
MSSVVGELGIYGVWLKQVHGSDLVLNEPVGHLLRTKSEDTQEGGVATGYAVIDSPLLVENDVYRRWCQMPHEHSLRLGRWHHMVGMAVTAT